MTIEPAPVTDLTEFPDLRRVAVIDVGSNSVRLVVFDGAARSPAYFFNEKVLCGLGRGLAETGRLNPDGRTRAILAMDRFAALMKTFDVTAVHTVATAAVRDATDGSAFVSEVEARTGISLNVASGEEEARLSSQGVLLGWPGAQGLVADIGGASMELAEVRGGGVGRRLTSPLGPLQLMDLRGADRAAQATHHIARMRGALDDDYGTLYLVGGSFRAIAKLDMARRSYPLQVVHEYAWDGAELPELLDWLEGLTPEAMAEVEGAASARHALLPLVAPILRQLVDRFAPETVAVSSYGIREGLLYEEMPTALRRRDPLIEACRSMEAGGARFPGFGEALADWLRPLLPDDPWLDRIITAAGLLHDVSWRSHPSARAEECFDNASRGNLGGIDHRGRVMLAMALLHRYRKSARLEKYHDLAPLLRDDDQRVARVLGCGLRLGASLAGGDASILSRAPLRLTERALELWLSPDVEQFAGEAIASRLDGLAAALGVTGVIATENTA